MAKETKQISIYLNSKRYHNHKQHLSLIFEWNKKKRTVDIEKCSSIDRLALFYIIIRMIFLCMSVHVHYSTFNSMTLNYKKK